MDNVALLSHFIHSTRHY
ncbi:hypothetical protein LINPERPRIM_LOCUS33782 [Linum perenne]